MILSEFAFLCGEEVMINLYLTMSSIPTDQLNVCAAFPCKLVAYCIGSSLGQQCLLNVLIS